MLRQEAIRRGLPLATSVVLLIDGAVGLAHMGRICFPTALQIVDFYHALEHAGKILLALLGGKEHPDYKAKLLLQDGVKSSSPRLAQNARAKAARLMWKRNSITSKRT